MKIGVVTGTAIVGGVNRVAIEEVKGLNRRGIDASFISLIKPTTSRWSELLSGVDVKYLAEARFIPGDKPKEIFQRVSHIFKNLEGEYDLLICHDLPAWRVGFRTQRTKKIPYICYLHVQPGNYTLFDPLSYVFKNRRIARYLQERWLKNAASIFVNSKLMGERLREHAEVNSQVLYPLTSWSPLPFADLPQKREDFLLTVHRIGAAVLFPNLLEILKRSPKSKLVIAGTIVPFRTEKVMKMFEDSEAKDRVKFVINPSQEDLRKLYLTARAYIHPYFEEFGLPALEATYAGCPVLTYQYGIYELFEGQYEEGFFKESDIAGFSRLVAELTNNEPKAIEMGGRQHEITAEYTPERHMDELVEVINKVMANA